MQMYDDIVEVLISKAAELERMASAYGYDEPRHTELMNKAKGVRLAISYVYQAQKGKLYG